MFYFGLINKDFAKVLSPYLHALYLLAATISTLSILIGGYLYITSSGNVNKLEKAKKVIRNSLIGLVVVLSASFLTNFLDQKSNQSLNLPNSVPKLEVITPKKSDSGLVDLIIKAITGVFSNVITSITEPIVNGFNYFLKGTPLPSKNSEVFNLWLSVLAIANGLFILVLILMGMHLMSFSILGLNELSISKLIGSSIFGFILMNSSIFIIDAIIILSNSLIRIIENSSAFYVFNSIKEIINDSSIFSLAGSIILIIFLVIAVILMVFYLMRIIGIYLGAILSPLIILLCLVPAFKDLMYGLMKKYFLNINIIFIHIIILELAGSLINNIDSNGGGLMKVFLALATLITLIKSPAVASQISNVATAPRMARQFAEKMIITTSMLGGAASTVGATLGAFKQSVFTPKYESGSYMSGEDYAIKESVHKTAEKIRNGEANINDLKGLKK